MNRFALFLGLLACCSALTINVGYFATTGLMAISREEKFYAAAGIDVNFVLVPGSVVAFNWLADGTIDGILTAADNSINRYYNGILNTTLLSGGDMAPDYILVGTNGVKTIADIKGKSVIVDALTSGYSAFIQRILFNNGLVLNQDYTFVAVGGTPARYAAIVAGQANGAPVYAALMTFPFSGMIPGLNRSDINILARASDYVAPYQSICYGVLTSRLSNSTFNEISTRFLEGYYLAYLFANNTANKAAVVADLQAGLNITNTVAQAAYNAIRDPVTGEVVNNLYISPLGMLNVVAIRQQFGGFTRQANFTAATLEKQSGGTLIDYTILKEAQRRALARTSAPSCAVTVSQSARGGLFLNTYTVTLTNTGRTAANPTLVSSIGDGILYFNLVPQLQFAGLSGGNNLYTLRNAPLAAGASVTFSYIASNMASLTASQAAAC